MSDSKFIISAFADEADSSIDGQIKALLKNGLQGLEIRGVDGKNVSSIDVAKAKEVKEKLDANGLMTWSIGSPIGKISLTDDFDKHLDLFKNTLEIANVLEAKNIRLFSFHMPKGEENIAPYFDEVVEKMSRFVELAKDTGIKLCHENEKGIYGDIATRCLELHKAIPELGCIFDPANFIQCGQDTLKAWELLKDRVTYMHIKDALASGSVVPAGRGDGNLPVILKEFYELGGRNLTIEPHLSIFKGLEGLEREGEQSNIGTYKYASKESAFDAAANALYEII